MEFIILTVLGGLSWLAGFGLQKLLKYRLRRFPEESIYIIPGFFRAPLLLVALVLMPLEVILPLAWLLGPENGINLGLGLGLPALMLPLLAFALIMLWIHYGAVVLTPEGVRRYELIGHREIPYRNIRAVEQKIYFLTPVTSVEGCSETIRFPRQIQNHPELYLALCGRLQANGKALGDSPASRDGVVDFPFEFGIRPSRLMWEKIAFVLLMLIFAIVATMGIWIQLAQGLLPPFTLESFFIIALFFIPFGIFFPILVIIAYRKTIDPDKPNRFVLHRDRIEVFYPHHRQECYFVKDLLAVELIPIQTKIKSSYGGVTVSQGLTHYEFRMRFTGGKRFIIPPNRLALFNQNPEDLRRVFRVLYGS